MSLQKRAHANDNVAFTFSYLKNRSLSGLFVFFWMMKIYIYTLIISMLTNYTQQHVWNSFKREHNSTPLSWGKLVSKHVFFVTSSKLRDTKMSDPWKGNVSSQRHFRNAKSLRENSTGNTHPAWFIRCIHVFFLVGKLGLSDVSRNCQRFWVAFFLYWYWINDIKHRSIECLRLVVYY